MKLNLGSGPTALPDYTNVDVLAFPGIEQVDLRERWPWADESIEEILASHFIEHLTERERCHALNEAWRVLKPGGKMTIVTPHWASCRAYGDPTHQWPPVSEFWFYYLNAEWRATQAPHTDVAHLPWGFSCHFTATWGYALHPDLLVRNADYQQQALAFYKEAAQDTHATLIKQSWPISPTPSGTSLPLPPKP